MTEIELPHEEITKTYCPKLCSFSGCYWNTPCILKEDLKEPKIIEGRNFSSDEEITMSIDEIENHIKPLLNPLQKIEGIVKHPKFVQVFFSHNCCALWALREVYGEDWQNYFKPKGKISNDGATYLLIDHLGDVQNNFQNKLKEKKVK